MTLNTWCKLSPAKIFSLHDISWHDILITFLSQSPPLALYREFLYIYLFILFVLNLSFGVNFVCFYGYRWRIDGDATSNPIEHANFLRKFAQHNPEEQFFYLNRKEGESLKPTLAIRNVIGSFYFYRKSMLSVALSNVFHLQSHRISTDITQKLRQWTWLCLQT